MENLELYVMLFGPSIVDYVSILGNPFLVEMVYKLVIVPATMLDQGFLYRVPLEKNLLIKRTSWGISWWLWFHSHIKGRSSAKSGFAFSLGRRIY